MTFTVQLTFDVHLDPLGGDEVERYVEVHPDSEAARRRVWRQQEILRHMASFPEVARAYAALSVIQQAHDELNDYLRDLLNLPHDTLFHMLRPAITRLPIEDQEALVDAEVEARLYDELGLLVDGGDVRLKAARLRKREP